MVTQDAERDFALILAYLKQEATAVVAEEFARDIRATLLHLVQFADSGPLWPELGPRVRIAIVYPYVLPYEHDVRQAQVVLLRILHGRSNVTADILMRR